MMLGNDPLLAYHTLLRLGRSSGYANLQNAAPHPYEMSLAAATSPLGGGFPFQAMQGRMLQHAGAGGLKRSHPVGLNMNRQLGQVISGVSHRTTSPYRPQNYRLAPTFFRRQVRR